jgi:hypothetical protein
MKRSNQEIKEVNEKPLRYQNLPGGLHYTADGRCVKKGEIFTCLPSAMSKTFISSFECLDKRPEDASDSGVHVEVRPAGKNKWDIVNTKTGAKLNNTSLAAAQAKNFLEKGAVLPSTELDKEEDEEEFDD